MSTPEPRSTWTTWRTSSYSNGGTGACVEVAMSASAVALRDSKNATGPTVTVTPEAWQTFLSHTAS